MKKSIIATLMLVLSMTTMQAQESESPVGKFSVIPRIGVTISNWSNNRLALLAEDGAEMKSKYQAGFMGGLDVEYRLTEQVGVSLGAYYAKQGFRFPSFQTEAKQNGKTVLSGYNNQHVDLNYLQVPLVLRAYVTRSLSLVLGAQVGFLCGDGKYKGDTSDMEIDTDGNANVIEKESIDQKWPTKKTDVSIPIGVSYEYMGVILDARYNLGLTKANKDDTANSKNRAFTFSVGYRFTL